MADRSAPGRQRWLAPGLAAVLACCPWLAHAGGTRPLPLTLLVEMWAGFDYPVLNVFLFLTIVTLLSVAVLRRRHRSELLAVCLALSLVLHLLSLSLFSVVPFGMAEMEVTPKARLYRVSIGAPSLRESLVGQGLRTESLLAPGLKPQPGFEADRVARRELVQEGLTKERPEAADAEARLAGRGDLKAADLVLPKAAMDEPLAAVPDRPVELASVKLAVPQPDRDAPKALPAEPGAREKRFEVAPAAGRPAPAEAPAAPQAALKTSSQAPAGTRMDLVAVEGRQPDLKDAIQPAAARAAVDRLQVPAKAVEEARQAASPAAAGPVPDVKLEKLAGVAPEPAVKQAAAPQAADPARMAADSVAAAGPAGIGRKKTEVEEAAPGNAVKPAHLDPLKIDAGRQTFAAARPDEAGQPVPDQAGRREWAATQEKRADIPASLPAPAMKPGAARAEVREASGAAGVRMELASVEGRQLEVREAIQPAAARAEVEHLQVRAGTMESADRGERMAAPAAAPDVKLAKLAGGVAEPAGKQVASAPKAADQARMASASIAAASPAGIDRKRNEMEDVAPGESANAERIGLVKMAADQQMAIAALPGSADRPAGPGQAGQRTWAATQEKRTDISSPLPAPTVKPGVASSGVREASGASAGGKMELASVEGRQLEVKDAIQPAAARAEVEHLQVRAGTVEGAGTGSGRGGRAAAPAAAADVKLEKLGGGAPEGAGQQWAAAPAAAGQPRMASDSIASETRGHVERKQTEVGWIAAETAPGATRLEPVKLSGQQQLIASARSGAPGQASSSAPDGRAELATSKEQGGVPGVGQLAGDKPRAGVADAAPSKEPIRIGLGGDAFIAPASTSPSVREAVSDLPAGRPGVQAIGVPAAMVASAQGEPGTPGQGTGRASAEKYGASDLEIVKQGGGGLESARAADSRGVPGRSAGIQAGGGSAAQSGSVIEGSGGGVQARGAASAEVKDQLAAGLPSGGGAGFADVGSPAQAVAGGARAASAADSGSGIRAVALALAKSRTGGVPADAGGSGGGIDRPAATGRSELPAGRDSFVAPGSGGGVGASRSAGSAVAGEGQLAAGTSVQLAGGDTKVLAGQVSLENPRGGGAAPAGGREGSGRGQAALSLAKSGGAADAGIASARVSAPAVAGGGTGSRGSAPAGTLVTASGLAGSSRAAAGDGIARGEVLMAMNTTAGVSDAGGPALVAQAVKTGGAAGGGGGSPGKGIAPASALQVAKAGGADALQSDQPGGGGRDKVTAAVRGAGERGPARMEMSLSEGPPSARVTSDISASPAGQGARRSFLSAGSVPKPDFVPDKAIYQMRKPEKRRQFIKELGGTAQTEQAVEQALDWLSRTQSDDGRWDVDGFKGVREYGGAGDLVNEDVAVTGLALLAYLGAGYTHLGDVHEETVRKALDWLLGCEKENGDLRGPGQMYSQAIATAALCEAYSLTGDARLRDPVRRAVQFIVDSQTPEAGWRYEPRNDSDTSVTGWQILALKSAQIAGLPVPAQTIKWTELWLDQVRHGDQGGLYAYKPGHAVTPVMTAEGAFCQLFMAEKNRTRGQAESTAYLMQNLPSWDPKNRTVHMYYWYYATLTLYLSGAKEFEAWNAALTQALLEGRRKSGPAVGSWDPVCQLGERGGRIYSTAAGALCLEVYYRFLPLYKQK